MKSRKQRTPKFLQIYNSLNEDEKKEFISFVRTRIIDPGRNYESLLLLISESTDDEKIKGKYLRDRTLWNRFSELTSIMEKFLAFKELLENDNKIKLYSARQLRKRNLDKLFISRTDILKSNFEDALFDEDYFRNQILIYTELVNYSFEKNDLKMYLKNLAKQDILLLANILLDLSFKKIELDFLKFNNIDFDPSLEYIFIDSINFLKMAELIRTYDEKIHEKVLLGYFLMKTAFNTEDLKYFRKAKKLFFKLKDSCTIPQKLSIFRILINQCFYLKDKSRINTDNELFEIFDMKLKEKLFDDLINPVMNLNHFRDFIIIGARTGHIEWVGKILKMLPLRTDKEKYQNDVCFANAVIKFYEKKFGESLDHFSRFRKVHYLNYIDAFKYSAMIYYEDSDFVNFQKEINYFRIFLKRHNEIPESFSVKYLNFIRNISILQKCKENLKSEKILLTEKEIQRNFPCAERGWINNQLKELVRKNKK